MARLGDVATYINGYAFKPSDWSNVGVPIIRIQDLTGNSYQANRYNGEYAKKYEVLPGDVLISWSASLGVYVWSGEKAVLNQHIFKVVFDKCDVDKSFFVHQVRNILEKAATSAHGATMKHLTKPIFDALPFYLPTLEEQNQIAAVLDKVSDLIAKRQAQLDKLDLLVKARFVEMFGDPVSNPKDWPLCPLCNCLIKIENGKSLVCANEARAGIVPGILKLSAATYGDYRPEENKAMLDASMFLDSAEVHADDLLFTRKNTPELVGMSTYVFETPEKLMMPDLIFRLDTNHRCNKIFLWKLINHDLFRSKIKALASGSAKSMSNISKERLGNLQIIVPPIELQGKFDTFVRQAYAERRKINCGLEKLETLKKALMQEFFW